MTPFALSLTRTASIGGMSFSRSRRRLCTPSKRLPCLSAGQESMRGHSSRGGELWQPPSQRTVRVVQAGAGLAIGPKNAGSAVEMRPTEISILAAFRSILDDWEVVWPASPSEYSFHASMAPWVVAEQLCGMRDSLFWRFAGSKAPLQVARVIRMPEANAPKLGGRDCGAGGAPLGCVQGRSDHSRSREALYDASGMVEAAKVEGSGRRCQCPIANRQARQSSTAGSTEDKNVVRE